MLCSDVCHHILTYHILIQKSHAFIKYLKNYIFFKNFDCIEILSYSLFGQVHFSKGATEIQKIDITFQVYSKSKTHPLLIGLIISKSRMFGILRLFSFSPLRSEYELLEAEL
jgi:predicted house-cleaning NTP pyrophosphatase (Maf/HAM1 superfamily)